jgi:endoglucanase
MPSPTVNDHYCWERPETMDYKRSAYAVNAGSDLAGEMAATMAAASIVFRDQISYSKRCKVAAQALLAFAQDPGKRGRYTSQISDPDSVTFYNSSGYWDEYIWANAWTYFATGNISYLARATTSGLARNANAGGVNTKFYGVLTWDNKLLGAQVR